VLKMLLEYNSDVRASDHEGRTALHYASLNGFFEGVQLLLMHGAQANQQDIHGCTPLHLASGKHCLLWETEQVYGSIISLLLKAGAKPDMRDGQKRTALHYASMYGHAHLVNQLIRCGVEIEVYDALHATPLHYASGKNGMLWNEKLDYFTISSELIACGALVSVVDDEGKSPLHYAAACGHEHLAKLLIDRGADSNLQDILFATPLHYACGKDSFRFMPRKYAPHIKSTLQIKDHEEKYMREEEEHVNLVAFLLRKGALSTTKDIDDKFPFDYAHFYEHKKIQALFVAHENK
jgi:uncharacterized protein